MARAKAAQTLTVITGQDVSITRGLTKAAAIDLIENYCDDNNIAADDDIYDQIVVLKGSPDDVNFELMDKRVTVELYGV